MKQSGYYDFGSRCLEINIGFSGYKLTIVIIKTEDRKHVLLFFRTNVYCAREHFALLLARRCHARTLLSGIQVGCDGWIPAKSMRE